jgi:hypothetical protein
MTTKASRATEERLAPHWRRLRLLSGAPDCVIKAAYRHFIEIHHPDRGGSDSDAKEVNAAFAELQGRGMPPNEHVATHYDGEPWHILGIASNADARLVERAAKALSSDLDAHPRLAARVAWAAQHFASAPRKTAPPRPPARARAAPPAPRPRAVAGMPEGLVERIDFGTLTWGAAATRDVRLTWRDYAPYTVRAAAASPVTVEVKPSKALPGRFVMSFSIDWDAEVLRGARRLRGYTLDSLVTVSWPEGEATVRVRGALLYPPVVTASPEALDLGRVRMGADVHTSLMLVSSAPADITVQPTPWLRRVDGAGRTVDGPVRLGTNTPMRVALAVAWEPIIERASGVPPDKPWRPTGKIVVRWDAGELIVPVEMIVDRR